MARMKRIMVPGYPHHVVQRGVRSMDIFFQDQDRVEYLRLLREQGDRFGVAFLSYCLMTNHVHLLAVPEKQDGLARAIGEGHRRYARMIRVLSIDTDLHGVLEEKNRTGRPFGSDRFYSVIEKITGRNTRPGKPGRPAKKKR